VGSQWHVPLPLEEYAKNKVVVYFYRGSWIPITLYPLTDAIKLHALASSQGMDIVLFPPNLDPTTVELKESLGLTDKRFQEAQVAAVVA